MLRELAIFEYVSGDQTPSAKRNFEQMMSDDALLLADVQAERALRAEMAEAGTPGTYGPVSMSNIEGLFARIDIAQRDAQESAAVDQVNNEQAQTARKAELINVASRTFLAPLAAAASVAFIALFFVNDYIDSTQPNFNTLSDGVASKNVDFGTLVDQGRLAKFTVSSELSANEVDDMLTAYGLSTFESGANSGELYVYTEAEISHSQTSAWRADSRVKEVKLFTVTE